MSIEIPKQYSFISIPRNLEIDIPEDILALVYIEKHLLDLKEFSALSEDDEIYLSYCQGLIPEYVRVSSIFKKRNPKDCEKVWELLLKTPSIDIKDIIFKRKEVIRVRKAQREQDKKDIKQELKEVKKEKKEGSWLDL